KCEDHSPALGRGRMPPPDEPAVSLPAAEGLRPSNAPAYPILHHSQPRRGTHPSQPSRIDLLSLLSAEPPEPVDLIDGNQAPLLRDSVAVFAYLSLDRSEISERILAAAIDQVQNHLGS